MWLALVARMGFAATLEMRTPEEHRERLHELVKSTRTVIVLSYTGGGSSAQAPVLELGQEARPEQRELTLEQREVSPETPEPRTETREPAPETREPASEKQEQKQDQIDGQPMALVRTGDDTTMYLATSFDLKQAEALERGARVTVVVQGAGYALFSGEARISRDRKLIDELWTDSWLQWFRGKWDPSIAIVIVSPIEGSYWEASDKHSYMYRLVDD
jgi:general stress protein 26